VKSEEIIGRF